MKREQSDLWRWLPMLLWMVSIFIVSNQPKSTIPSYGVWDWVVKKGAHMLAYALLASLARRVTGASGAAFL
ncbi:MAG TPA: hypothetical protein VE553_03875, partial [Candidatus Binatia bacterium]|nr:hypothetical protein [Candidatus Binatia bacterium]